LSLKINAWIPIAFISCSVLSIIFFIGCWLQTSISFILQPFPLEYRDWAGIHLTEQFLSGREPYSFTEGPPFFHVYGFVFPALIALIKDSIGSNTLFLTKMVVISCVFLSASLISFEVQRLTRAPHLSLIAFALMLWANWNENMFFILRPDAFATFITLLTLVVLRQSHSTTSLVAAAIATTILFYTKSYFIIIIFSILFYLSMVASWRQLGVFITSFILVFATTIVAVLQFYPAYFYATLIAQANAAEGLWIHSYTQFLRFYQNYWPLLILFLVSSIQTYKSYSQNKIKNKINTTFGSVANALKSSGTGIYFCYLLVAMVALFPLGKNTGAFLSYHYQLLLPSLSIIGMVALSKIKSDALKNLTISIVIIFCIYHVQFLYHKPAYTFDEIERWHLVRQDLAADVYPHILISSPILSGIRVDKDAIFLDDGQSEWYSSLRSNINSPKVFNLFRRQSTNYWQSFENFYRQVDNRIIEKKFDAIVVTKDYHPMISQIYLDKYYFKSKEINLKTGAQSWPIEFWLPKK
jgi:hypothetical protein